MEHAIKPLKYKSLSGLSERQLAEHHDVLYAGYVKKINEIRSKLTGADFTAANASYSDFREMKLEETFAMNGVRLHEFYFDNLGPSYAKASEGEDNNKAVGAVAEWIKQDFGSYEKWLTEFVACGISARGWVVLAFDLEDGKLTNYLCDVHNQGGVWACVPLLVLDVYEHAYFLDYATARKAYIETFVKNIDWNEVNKRIDTYKLREFRK